MLKLTFNGAFCMLNFLNTPFRGLGQKYPGLESIAGPQTPVEQHNKIPP